MVERGEGQKPEENNPKIIPDPQHQHTEYRHTPPPDPVSPSGTHTTHAFSPKGNAMLCGISSEEAAAQRERGGASSNVAHAHTQRHHRYAEHASHTHSLPHFATPSLTSPTDSSTSLLAAEGMVGDWPPSRWTGLRDGAQAFVHKHPVMAAFLNGFALEVAMMTTVGQPLDVLRIRRATHRRESVRDAFTALWKARGIRAFHQGLMWSWMEAVTGGVLLASNRVLRPFMGQYVDPTTAIVLSGVCAAVPQSITMCVFVNLRVGQVSGSQVDPNRKGIAHARAKLQEEGLQKLLFRGLGALMLRQCTNWGSRFGFKAMWERIFENSDAIRDNTSLPTRQLLASLGAGMLSCWNQPFDVLMNERQSMSAMAFGGRVSYAETARRIYAAHGVMGFYRGVAFRSLLTTWSTVMLLCGNDYLSALETGARRT